MNESEVEYFDRLIARSGGAVSVPAEPFEGALPAKCHDNAGRFADANPGFCVIRGWLIAKPEGFPQYLLNAHSVVRRQSDGALLDVTPIAARDRAVHRFLEHDGDEESFTALKIRYAQLIYPPVTAMIGR